MTDPVDPPDDPPADPPADPPVDPPSDPPADPPADPPTDDAEKWKALARKHEKESKARAKRISDLEKAGQTESERAVSEARDAATKETRDRYAGRLFAAELRSIARDRLNVPATLLADPDVGRKLLSLDDYPVDDDGDVDTQAISDAVDRLLEKDPTLATSAGTKKPPKVPTGPRGDTPKDLDDHSVDDFRELLDPKK